MTSELKIGLIASGALVGYLLLLHLLTAVTGNFGWLAWLQLLYPVWVVLFVVFGVFKKSKENPAGMKFGQGFFAGLAVAIMATVVLAFAEFALGSIAVTDLPERAASYHGQQAAADVFQGKPPAAFPDSVRVRKDELVKNVVDGARGLYEPRQRAQTVLLFCMILGSLTAAVAAFAWRKPPPPMEA